MDFAAEKRRIETNLVEFERIRFRSFPGRVDISGRRAIIHGTYTMTVVVRGKELTLEGEEHIRLAKEADGWKIVGGL